MKEDNNQFKGMKREKMIKIFKDVKFSRQKIILLYLIIRNNKKVLN